MNRSDGRWFAHMLVPAAIFAATLASCRAPSNEIVVGSTLIQGIVHDLAGNRLPARCLIPPGMCPGHFDMKPGDVAAAQRARIILLHAWQEPMASVQGLVNAANVTPERIEVIGAPGNWMQPGVYAEAIDAVAEVLCRIDPGNAPEYRENAATRRKAVQAFGEQVKRELEQRVAGPVKVLANDKQSDFLQWAGFEVVATYGRPEDLSVADTEDLIRRAQAAGAALFVDNLQSGDTRMSDAVARDAGVARVTLSNFPGGFDGTETWEEALRHNVRILLAALDSHE